MKYPFSFLLIVLLFANCEDTQKTSEEKKQVVKELQADTLLSEKKPEKKEPETKQYPEITNDNVVAFLTQYGAENPETKVKITTQFGAIFIELYEDTPLHRANFVYLVKQHYFDDTFFHRVVPNFIIQGGNSDRKETPRKRNTIGAHYLLPAELANGRKHTRGTVSGAKEYRENPDKRTAPFEFFIFLGPDKYTSHLNGNYTIFGRVTQGMDVVDTIANLPSDDGEWPLQNLYITAEVIR
ncbi:MAG: peptidylprolyl isomerase [Flavobacteriaceae bacterium]